MTTVAWKDGVLAADRMGSQGDTAYKTTKLFKTRTHAIAVAGNIATGIKFVKWFQGNREDSCPLDENTIALVMDLETGKCEQWQEPGAGVPVEDRFVAIGSGQDVALGAMAFGASAAEAVKCAIAWDCHSGLGVSSVKSKAAKKKTGTS